MVKAGCPEFVCEKCGVAREKIFKVDYKVRGIRSDKEKHFNTNNGARKNMPFMGDKQVQELGYTSCSCPQPTYKSGIVLDPFMGSGTVAIVAKKLGRDWLGIELNPKYIKISTKRINAIPEKLL